MIEMLKQKKIVALVAPMGLALGVALAPATSSAGFLTYGDSQGVVNSYKECWQAQGGMDAVKGPAECGDCSKRDSDGDGVNDCDDKCPNTPKGQKVNKQGCEIVSVTLSSEVLFDFDKATLKPAGKAALDELAAKVKATPGNEMVDVVGHTDPIGSDAYNDKLSQRRADSVTSYLRGAGINVSSSKGMGERQLVKQCPGGKSAATIECNAPNRRVDISARP